MHRVGHLEKGFHIFGYLKEHPKRKLGFEPANPDINKNSSQKGEWMEFCRDAE